MKNKPQQFNPLRPILADFEKYRNTLEHIQIPALLRHWGTNSFSKAKIVRDIKHLQAFFLDLSTANVEQFFQMVSLKS